ncbi:MAG: hypothetical protein NWF00_08575 [Candidatus Bathyarchaeota archaeon]|nr:hypothetical protein [Candidatus Bathyarchaeota archaeon]
MKCGDCGQEILQEKPEMCPYCRSRKLISEEDNQKEIREIEKLVKAGRFEEAALKYEKMEMWNEAKGCRKQDRKKHAAHARETGKVEAISVLCPHCSESQSINSKVKEAICNRCGTTYKIPSRALELLTFEEKK